ncbi:hypothetical protein [Hymenobacter properus]|uniref:Uncharacterized protein n=1 Tax=Hymenobacter properus TaxID=2791026 RepID=A0A931BIH8_9BACT|nr:hypothetical protein [Hymenobacter properus]MBF9140808.1 hypothetical protein [Hymenobacter properus]MBR7719617.1 hypothetical protein [Microvirga sp. SRT04]
MQVASLQQYQAQQAQIQALSAKLADLEWNGPQVLARTYHLGTVPTPGRGYDDRLTTRTGLGKTKLRELLDLGPIRGGLRRVRAGDKWLVTEAAVREFFGEPAPTN